jgi:hypothetical protein
MQADRGCQEGTKSFEGPLQFSGSHAGRQTLVAQQAFRGWLAGCQAGSGWRVLLLLLFIYCNWVCTRWQWSLYYTITTKNIQYQQQKIYNKNKYIP